MFNLLKNQVPAHPVIRFGDWLHNKIFNFTYKLTYPLFSIIRAAWEAIKESWTDAE